MFSSRQTLAIAIVAFLAVGAAARPANGQRIGRDLVLGRVLAATTDAAGRICVADDLEHQIHCLRPDGTLEWSVGRRGEGPGEFQAIYRLALTETSVLYAYDMVAQSISRFDRKGRFRDRVRLPFGVAQVMTLAAVGADRLVLTAKANGQDAPSDSAIHVVRFMSAGGLVRERSFGPLPSTTDPRVSRFFGPGIATITSRGTILYSRRYPYEILEYSVDGTLLRRDRGPVTTIAKPEDIVRINATADRISYSPNPTPPGDRVTVAAQLAGGRIAVLRIRQDGQRVFDVLDRARGRWQTSAPVGDQEFNAVLFDWKESSVILLEECDDEPCLVRRPLRIGGW